MYLLSLPNLRGGGSWEGWGLFLGLRDQGLRLGTSGPIEVHLRRSAFRTTLPWQMHPCKTFQGGSRHFEAVFNSNHQARNGLSHAKKTV